MLTGIWASDGENVDPAGNQGTAPVTATLGSLNGTDPNGTWVLFLSDASPGSQSILDDWTLNITTAAVPEPSVLALIGFGAVCWIWLRLHRHQPGKAACVRVSSRSLSRNR